MNIARARQARVGPGFVRFFKTNHLGRFGGRPDWDTVDGPARLLGQLRRRWCLLGSYEGILPQGRRELVQIL